MQSSAAQKSQAPARRPADEEQGTSGIPPRPRGGQGQSITQHTHPKQNEASARAGSSK